MFEHFTYSLKSDLVYGGVGKAKLKSVSFQGTQLVAKGAFEALVIGWDLL